MADNSLTSILISTKKLLGIAEDYNQFDTDILLHINSTLLVLYQLGVLESPYTVTGKSDTWSDLLEDDEEKLEAVKSYIYLKVRMMFDPPAGGSTADAFERSIQEFEWRLNVAVDPGEDDNELLY